jgi:cyclopropane fatty-acyl-phospholipid synthase-like methyltransferase
LLECFPDIRGIGFDISAHSLQFTKDLVGIFGHGDRYTIEERDIRHGYKEQCDFMVCQEVLEHLENPEEFCTWLFNMIKPGGHAYITAALNAAHSDHIFHFRDPLQLEAMLRAAGFQPMSLQEEFAAGYKPREITPSLAGYLVERRK